MPDTIRTLTLSHVVLLGPAQLAHVREIGEELAHRPQARRGGDGGARPAMPVHRPRVASSS